MVGGGPAMFDQRIALILDLMKTLFTLSVTCCSIISCSSSHSNYSLFFKLTRNFYLIIIFGTSFQLIAQRSAGGWIVVSFADFEIKAPTSREIRATSIMWNNVNPSLPPLPDEVLLAVVF